MGPWGARLGLILTKAARFNILKVLMASRINFVDIYTFYNEMDLNVVELLFEELNKLGTTIVVATHNEAMVQQLGHPVMRLDAGALAITPGTRSHNQGRGAGV